MYNWLNTKTTKLDFKIVFKSFVIVANFSLKKKTFKMIKFLILIFINLNSIKSYSLVLSEFKTIKGILSICYYFYFN